MLSDAQHDSTQHIRTQIYRRISKACERCRERKIRCVPAPDGLCGPCQASGLTECFVRERPRRKRIRLKHDSSVGHDDPWPKKPLQTDPFGPLEPETNPLDSLNVHPLDSIDSLDSFDSRPNANTSALSASSQAVYSPSVQLHAGPLSVVEELLISWCAEHGVSPDGLVVSSSLRVAPTRGKPLPQGPARRAFEDDLMRRFDRLQGLEHLKTINQSGVPTLYAKYRVLPNTVSADKRGLLQAVLCLSCCSDLRPHEGGSMMEEAITYYHLALESIREWARPSLSSMWALTILVAYTYRMRDLCDTQSLLQQMAWHVVELGLHKQETTDLYTPEENVGLIFSNYIYSDILRACMTDLRPTIPLSDIDAAVSLSPANSSYMYHASSDTADYIRDYWSPRVDTTSLVYVESAEQKWGQRLREFRRRPEVLLPGVVAWVEFRYHWLRILLHIPLLRRHPTSYAVIARAVSQILYGHIHVAETGYLEQAWPQLQRLVVCGQLLLLCEAQEELHPLEKDRLWDILFAMLAKISPQWPRCDEYASAFRSALHQSERQPAPGPAAALDTPAAAAGDPSDSLWNDVGFDADSLVWWLTMGQPDA